ncbi:MAG: site-specific integrase, partial [Firmicutes bacterium]|nr:site-specific integrase [Bacillota bacterium]
MGKKRGNNEGCITRRKDGRWQGAVIVGRDPETGGYVRKFFYGRTRQEVADKVNRALAEVQAGLVSPKGGRVTLGEWLRTWLEVFKKPHVRQTTWENYEVIVRRHVPDKLAATPLEKLRAEELQKLYLAKEKEDLAPRTIRLLHVVIHAALKQAVKLGYVARNVADAATPPRVERREIQVLTEEEVGRFLEAARGYRLFPAFHLLVGSGLRRGELLGLRWQDVNLEAGTVTVERSLVATRTGPVFQEPKTRSGRRTVPLPRPVVRSLKAWRVRWKEERLKLGPDWPHTDLVFPTEVGTPIHPRNFLRAFKQVLAKAGLPETITVHAIRHTYATLLL